MAPLFFGVKNLEYFGFFLFAKKKAFSLATPSGLSGAERDERRRSLCSF